MKCGTAYIAKRGWGLLVALLCGLHCAHGQVLGGASADPELPTVKLRPQVRSDALAANTMSAQQRQAIEPFLSMPQVFTSEQYPTLARIMGGQGQRSLFTQGDTVYARTPGAQPLLLDGAGSAHWNIYSDPINLKDPVTGAVLGMQAQYLGRARLRSSEQRLRSEQDGKPVESVVPAVLEIIHAVAEIRAGDRLLKTQEAFWRDLTERPAPAHITARVVSIYGSGVAHASQHQIVVLNQGTGQGLQAGHVMAFDKKQSISPDTADPAQAVLPPAPGVSGQALVFLSFENLSYALVGEVSEPVQVGDRLRAP